MTTAISIFLVAVSAAGGCIGGAILGWKFHVAFLRWHQRRFCRECGRITVPKLRKQLTKEQYREQLLELWRLTKSVIPGEGFEPEDLEPLANSMRETLDRLGLDWDDHRNGYRFTDRS